MNKYLDGTGLAGYLWSQGQVLGARGSLYVSAYFCLCWKFSVTGTFNNMFS